MFRFMPVVCLLSITACTPMLWPKKDLGSEVKVIFELCRPGHDVAEGVTLSYSVVRPDGYQGGSLAADKVFASKEPVYYHYAETPRRLRALVARFSDAEQTSFIYEPPAKLRLDAWSSWMAPTAVSTDSRIEARLQRGIAYTTGVSEGPVPRIRYRLMKFVDYLATVKRKDAPLRLLEGESCPV